MSYADNPYQSPLGVFAAQAAADERSDFITKTYLHLAGAIGLFVVLEAVLLNMPGTEGLVQLMISGRYGWLIVLGLFMLVSHVADELGPVGGESGHAVHGLGLVRGRRSGDLPAAALHRANGSIRGSYPRPPLPRWRFSAGSRRSSSSRGRIFLSCGPCCFSAAWRRWA